LITPTLSWEPQYSTNTGQVSTGAGATPEGGGMMFNEVKTVKLYSIDETDAEIIDALDEDVRSTYTSLAKRIGVDQVTVRRRLDKLLESGVIRLGVLVDYSRIGPSLHVLFALSIRSDSVDSVLEEVGKLPQVSWVTSVTGRFDSIALGRFSSYEELGEFIHKDLNSIKGILRSETFVFLRREKSFYSPLEKSSKPSFLVT
jgi:Lrp/AsnC family transcriptional regulator for asnA, asnC and gidA